MLVDPLFLVVAALLVVLAAGVVGFLLASRKDLGAPAMAFGRALIQATRDYVIAHPAQPTAAELNALAAEAYAQLPPAVQRALPFALFNQLAGELALIVEHALIQASDKSL